MKRGKATLPLAERSRRVFLGGLRRRFAGVLMLSAVRHVSLASLLLAAVLSLLVPGFVDAQPTTTRVSVGPGGAKANGDSCYTGVWADNACTAISADGRWVAFRSLASNLVAGDTNGHADVFVHDRGTGETRRVSVGSGSAEGDGDSEEPTISADGRWVAFSSWASNLVVGDTNLRRDVFVHDQQTGTTTRVSVGTGGAQGNGDGQFPSISADGRWVAFESRASNLVPGDTNLSWDVLVHDRETGTTTRVSVGSGGAEGNGDSSYASISGDGRWVAFRSYASNLVPRDTNRGINPISGADVFLHDRESGTTTRVSVASDGTQANGSSTDSAVSADGRRVAFFSVANNLVANDTNSRTDVFVHDRQTGTTRRVSVGPGGAQGNGESYFFPAISADGRWVAFSSTSSNLVANDKNGTIDAFVYDWDTETTTRVSVATDGTEANGYNGDVAISADGRSVAFRSTASNLVAGDTNAFQDVFVHDRGDTGCVVTPVPTSVSAPAAGADGTVLVLATAGCAWTAVSSDPSWLAVTGGASGIGVGTVTYHVVANAGGPRTGTLTIGGQVFMLTQTQPPSTAPDTYATPVGTPLLVAAPGVLANDSHYGGGAMTAELVGGPVNGTLSLGADGAFVYDPDPDFNEAEVFTYRAVTPGGGPGNVASVWIAVGPSPTTRVSVGPAGVQGNGDSPSFFWRVPAISADGRSVAFSSGASNLVVGDTNLRRDVFVHDRQTGTTTRVSVATGGAQGTNGGSGSPAISADGRWVAFESEASNLVAGDTNGAADVFVHDRETGTTTRVSVGPGGTQRNSDSLGPTISADGRWVAFWSFDGPDGLPSGGRLLPPLTPDVFVHDRETGTTTRVSVGSGGTPGNGWSADPSISADGRWVAFWSNASNLVAHDTNGRADVFVRDLRAQTTTRVSVATDGTQGNGHSPGSTGYESGPAISADGRWVAFESEASNLVAGDTNNRADVFVHDRQTGTTTRVSVGSGGAQTNEGSGGAAISADGRWVAFTSSASNLVAGDTNGESDVFVHDRQTETTTRVSVGPRRVQGNDRSEGAAVSADGRWVGFHSSATNLVLDDTNGYRDVFVHDRGDQGCVVTLEPMSVSVPAAGAEGTVLVQSAPACAWTAVSNDPSWLIVTGGASGTGVGTVSYRVAANAGVPRTGAIWVGRATFTVTQTLPPTAFNDAYATAYNTPVTVAAPGVLANDDSNGGGAMTAALVQGGYGAVTLDADGGFRYTPRAGFHGPDTFTYRAVNWAGPGDTATVTITVGSPPPPTTVPDTYATAFNTPLVVADPGVLANDEGFGQAMLVQLVGPPASGTLSIGPFGGFTYTPNLGFTGTDTFTYRALSAVGAGNVANVSITVADATPLPPTGLVAHTVVGNTVTLRWTIPPGGATPTDFVVEGGLHPGEVRARLPTGSATPTLTFEAPTGSFYVRVHALNGALRSAASNEIRLHVHVPVPPSAPAQLLGVVNGSTLALAWTNTYAGGAPTALALDVTGSVVTSVPLAVGDRASFAGVPGGTYTLALRALNAGGSSPPSTTLTVTVPGACSGPPLVPSNVFAYRVGNTVYVDWAPAASGPAPTGYVLHVSGSWVGSLSTPERALDGEVGPGAYTVSVVAVNWCGASPSSPPQTIVVP